MKEKEIMNSVTERIMREKQQRKKERRKERKSGEGNNLNNF